MKQIVVTVFFCGLMALVQMQPCLGGDSHRGLTMAGIGGDVVEIDSLLVSGPVVLNFWTTWCKPCQREMPQIERIYRQLDSTRVHFAAVSLDGVRNKKAVEAFIKKYRVGLPVYYDIEWNLAKRFKVMGIPTTIILDADAEIQYQARGYRPGDEIVLKKKIESLLGQDAEPAAPEP